MDKNYTCLFNYYLLKKWRNSLHDLPQLKNNYVLHLTIARDSRFINVKLLNVSKYYVYRVIFLCLTISCQIIAMLIHN